MNSRSIKIATVLVATAVALTACSSVNTSATKSEQQSAATGLAKLLKSQPIPQYDWSQVRQTLIDAETAQANTTQTTSFFFNLGVADPVLTCPSIGFPVAATSEITNPSQLIGNGGDQNYYGVGVVGQIDPNGIYSGNTSATFVLCVGANGKPYLEHAEEQVHAVAGPATWDYAKHRIVMTGDPSFAVKVGK